MSPSTYRKSMVDFTLRNAFYSRRNVQRRRALDASNPTKGGGALLDSSCERTRTNSGRRQRIAVFGGGQPEMQRRSGDSL
jgi:hypothetical protein